MSTIESQLRRPDRAGQARSVLRGLQSQVDCVCSCALVSLDGTILACVLAEGVSGDRFGAMCASLLALAARAAGEAGRGALRRILLDAEGGPMLLTPGGEVGVLAIAADPTPNVGRLILAAQHAAAVLAELYATPVQ